MTTLEKNLNQRFNTMIAIMRKIEKSKISPTHAMIELLYEQHSRTEKELLLEKKITHPKNGISTTESSIDRVLRRKLHER